MTDSPPMRGPFRSPSLHHAHERWLCLLPPRTMKWNHDSNAAPTVPPANSSWPASSRARTARGTPKGQASGGEGAAEEDPAGDAPSEYADVAPGIAVDASDGDGCGNRQ